MATQAITDSNFQETLDSNPNCVIVDFWAEWCGPCKMLAPILEAVSDMHPDNLSIYKLNTDENPTTAQSFQITSIPCCIVFKQGKEVHRIIGHKTKEHFEEEIKPFL